MINKKSHKPIYQQVIDYIREKISSDEWQPGFKLPPEDIFAEHLKISRGTLRKAIKKMVDEKTLETVHGKGTFVRKIDQDNMFVEGLFETAEQLNWFGLNLSVKVIEQKIMSCGENNVCNQLSIEPTSKIIFSRKSYSRNGMLVAVQDTYVPLENVASMLNINKLQGVELLYTSHKIETRQPPQQVKQLFGLSEDESFLCDSYIVSDEKKTPIEFKRSWFRNLSNHKYG